MFSSAKIYIYEVPFRKKLFPVTQRHGTNEKILRNAYNGNSSRRPYKLHIHHIHLMRLKYFVA